MDLDTQEILSNVREAEESGESDNVFLLYVATPRKPPASLHKKIIEPFLKERGWRKVSYRNTGFRALYFLRRKTSDRHTESDDGPETSRCDQCHSIISDDLDDFQSVSGDDTEDENKSGNETCATEKSFSGLNATQKATNHRTELKQKIEDYKRANQLSFQVHIVLSRPLDYEVDFVGLAGQQGSVEF